MENDVLKNKIAPWQEKGRWYHGVVDPVTSSFVNEKTDKFILDNFTLYSSSSSSIYLNPSDIKYKGLLSVVLISDNFTRAGSTTVANYYMTGTGKQMVLASPSGTAGTCEFWAFIVED